MKRHIALVAAILVAVAASAVGLTATPAAAAVTCGAPYSCVTFTIVLQGDGSGRAQSATSSYVPNGLIDCHETNGVTDPGSTCSHTYKLIPGTSYPLYIRLTADAGSCYKGDPDPDSPCVPAGTQLFPISDFTATVSQWFTFLAKPIDVSVTESGSGSGSVMSLPAGIACPGTCSATFKGGYLLYLVAAPDAGSVFKSWSGACAGQGPTCSLRPTAATQASAVFEVPLATPHPTSTPRSTATPHPTATPRPTATRSAAPSASPSLSPNAPSLPTAPSSTPASIGSPSPNIDLASPERTGVDPPGPIVASSAPDPGPIAVAILLAGSLIAVAVFAGLTLRRRRS